MLFMVSFVIGCLFGAIFGIIDVEDYRKNSIILFLVLRFEISICEPIGFTIGAFAGFMLEYLRQEEMSHMQ